MDKEAEDGQTGAEGGGGGQSRQGLAILVRSWDFIPSVIGSRQKVLNRGTEVIQFMFLKYHSDKPARRRSSTPRENGGRDGKMRLDGGYILEAKLIRLADGLDVECEAKENWGLFLGFETEQWAKGKG